MLSAQMRALGQLFCALLTGASPLKFTSNFTLTVTSTKRCIQNYVAVCRFAVFGSEQNLLNRTDIEGQILGVIISEAKSRWLRAMAGAAFAAMVGSKTAQNRANMNDFRGWKSLLYWSGILVCTKNDPERIGRRQNS
jgi:hypothetical protein